LYISEHPPCKANNNPPQCTLGELLTANSIEFIAGFFVAMAMTFVIIPWLIPRLKARGVVGIDLNKPSKPEVAEMGGIAVVVGFFAE
jgi:hypothetical protein